MKKLKQCKVQNCIPTPTSCNEWNGGDIPYLGICDGDSLNDLIIEIINKLKDITQDDLSKFDIDGLLSICNQKAPTEINIISILELVRDNQICFKDYLDNISKAIRQVSNNSSVVVDLKCYAEFDNLGNSLSITRNELDQLVINALCNQKKSIETLEGKVIYIQQEIDELSKNKTESGELSISTCIDAAKKPVSSQVIKLAESHCNLETALGTPAEASQALALIPADWAAKYANVTGWNSSVTSIAEFVGNMAIVIKMQGEDIANMKNTCCKVSCDDILIGFSAIFNEDKDGIILKFTSGAGTFIPAGFTDKGSTVVIKDLNGAVETANIAIANNAEIEIPITGLYTGGDLTIDITSKLGDSTLNCEKHTIKTLKSSGCGICEISATGVEGATVVIVYDSDTIAFTDSAPAQPTTTTTTTTSSTTTTTTTV